MALTTSGLWATPAAISGSAVARTPSPTNETNEAVSSRASGLGAQRAGPAGIGWADDVVTAGPEARRVGWAGDVVTAGPEARRVGWAGDVVTAGPEARRVGWAGD